MSFFSHLCMPEKKEDAHFWKKKLSSEQYHVLREKGTESPFTGQYVHTKESGMYSCAACGSLLFSSTAKFDSGTGWPSFDDPIAKDAIELKDDTSLGMKRIEVTCKKCGGHLGHVFTDGPTKTKQRYCINSCTLDFKKK